MLPRFRGKRFVGILLPIPNIMTREGQVVGVGIGNRVSGRGEGLKRWG